MAEIFSRDERFDWDESRHNGLCLVQIADRSGESPVDVNVYGGLISLFISRNGIAREPLTLIQQNVVDWMWTAADEYRETIDNPAEQFWFVLWSLPDLMRDPNMKIGEDEIIDLVTMVDEKSSDLFFSRPQEDTVIRSRVATPYDMQNPLRGKRQFEIPSNGLVYTLTYGRNDIDVLHTLQLQRKINTNDRIPPRSALKGLQ